MILEGLDFYREEWETKARCNDGHGTLVELFFSESLADIEDAKAYCGGCAVRSQCLNVALTHREPWGVWGGEEFVKGKIHNTGTARRPNNEKAC